MKQALIQKAIERLLEKQAIESESGCALCGECEMALESINGYDVCIECAERVFNLAERLQEEFDFDLLAGRVYMEE